MASSGLLLAALVGFVGTALSSLARDGAPIDAGKQKAWTVLVYGAADNSADSSVFGWIHFVRRAIADDPAFHVVVFVDRSKQPRDGKGAAEIGEAFTGGRLYEIHEKTASRLDGGEEFPEVRVDRDFEPDSADPATLRKFIRYGKAHFPAQHTALILFSHADGISMCPDLESGREMGLAELTAATEEEDAVDFTGLDLCNMAGVEVAYQWRPGNGGFSTQVLLAVPNAGQELDWDRVFARMHAPGSPAAKGRDDVVDPARIDAREFARLAVEEARKGRLAFAERRPEQRGLVDFEAGAAFDLTAIDAVKRAVDEFARSLWRADAKAILGEALRGGPEGLVLNYVANELDGERPFVDLYDLLSRAAKCEKLDESTRANAKLAMVAVEKLLIGSFGMSGYKGFEPGRNGLFVVFPVEGVGKGEAAAPKRAPHGWSALTWYSPNELKRPKSTVGNLAWCRDGAIAGDDKVENWFELLDAWFDTGSGTDGGLNGYRW